MEEPYLKFEEYHKKSLEQMEVQHFEMEEYQVH